MKIKICAVAAISENYVIGQNGSLPWKLPADLKRFKHLTLDCPVIMGRCTWDSLPSKPLKDRDNIIVTSDKYYATATERTYIVHNIESAIEAAFSLAKKRSVERIWIIGGSEIYAQTYKMWNELHLTHVRAIVKGNHLTFFPKEIINSINSDEWKLSKGTCWTQPKKHSHFMRIEEFVKAK